MIELQSLKEDVAQNNGFASWDALMSSTEKTDLNEYIDIIAFQYAQQVAEQALKDAARKHRDTHKTLSDWENAIEEIRETPILTP